MKYTEAMIAWNPKSAWIAETGTIQRTIIAVPWPDKNKLAREYLYTCGACYLDTRDLSQDALSLQVFIDFNTIVVRDGIPAQDAHEAFLCIDEYLQHIASDIKAAG